MNYIVQVAVEAADGKAAANMIPNELTVISVNPRPQPAQAQVGGSSVQGSRPTMTMQKTPTTTVTKQVGGA
jgi:hypothetical protein